jgi:hypothetical protein
MQDSSYLLKKALVRVKSGEESFAPADESVTALRDFQSTVKALKCAQESGLIETANFRPPSKRRDIYGLVQQVIVTGGLTLKGEDYLARGPAKTPSQLRKWAVDNLTQLVIGVASGLVVVYIAAKWLGQ